MSTSLAQALLARAAATCIAIAVPVTIVSALAPPRPELYIVETAATREASLACGFGPTTVHAWFDSHNPRQYPPNNISLGCGLTACRVPDKNPVEICVSDWAERNGYVYKPPPMCTYECGV